MRHCNIERAGEWSGLRLPAVTAQRIVVGTIAEVGPARWNTPDGQRPARTVCDGEPLPNAIIYTPARVRVEQVVKGAITSAEIDVLLDGGTVGPDSLLTFGDQPLVADQRVLLFLVAIPAGQFILARYTINPDGTAAPSLVPTDSRPLQQLLSEIASLIAAPSPSPGSGPTTPATSR